MCEFDTVSGPASVSFANAAAIDTTVTCSATGTYTLRLTANDGTTAVSDNIVITVSTLPTYTVSYQRNNHTGGMAPSNQIKTHDVGLTLSGAGILMRTGHTFTGWNTAADGIGTHYAAGSIYSANFTVLAPYSAWANGFLPADVSNPAGNNDGDTLTNLLEFAFGMNPTSPVLAPLSYVSNGTTSPGTSILENAGTTQSPSYRAVFARRKNHAMAGIFYQVQFSANLHYWKASNEVPAILSGETSDAIEAVSIPFPTTVPLSAAETEHAAPKFFRVAVMAN